MNYNRNIIANKIKSDCFKHSTSETNCYIHTSKKRFHQRITRKSQVINAKRITDARRITNARRISKATRVTNGRVTSTRHCSSYPSRERQSPVRKCEATAEPSNIIDSICNRPTSRMNSSRFLRFHERESHAGHRQPCADEVPPREKSSTVQACTPSVSSLSIAARWPSTAIHSECTTKSLR